MTFQRPRTGVFVLVDGQEREAESFPANGFVTLRGGGSVPVAECARVDEVTTRADYRGHECQVVGISDEGSVGLFYLGPDKAKAAADGFVQVDPGTWAKNVNVHELSRFREHHADLLFSEWAARR